ncbi:MAG TPA: hypothetical protein VMA71_00950 [Alloacidobacterium sp.]|nr:hypothetical protein [Alloacidobacterium sp.]
MRTTVTLDPDVVQMLRKTVRERDVTFKQAVNEAIRAGLKKDVNKRPKFRQRTFSMGAEQLFPWDKALQVAAALEDEELIRKMALGK